METPQSKGRSLENAVEAIETMILAHDPSLSESKSFEIERNKIFRINGVKHEIDIYVKINLNNGYDSIIIIECKNWENQSVGKNEIIAFSEKIKVINANKGFFMATNFTQDAEAQAKLDTRMLLFKVQDLKDNFYPFPIVSYLNIDKRTMKISTVLIENGADNKPDAITEVIDDTCETTLNGEKIDIQKYIGTFVDLMVEEETHPNKLASSGLGFHFLDRQKVIELNKDVLMNQDKRIIRMEIYLKLTYSIFEPVVISNFNIEKRGRFIHLQSSENEDFRIELKLTASN